MATCKCARCGKSFERVYPPTYTVRTRKVVEVIPELNLIQERKLCDECTAALERFMNGMPVLINEH